MVLKLVMSAILLGLGISLSACGSERGWRVEFGVAPVSNLHNEAGLKEPLENRKY
jgi:hypothetical protein